MMLRNYYFLVVNGIAVTWFLKKKKLTTCFWTYILKYLQRNDLISFKATQWWLVEKWMGHRKTRLARGISVEAVIGMWGPLLFAFLCFSICLKVSKFKVVNKYVSKERKRGRGKGERKKGGRERKKRKQRKKGRKEGGKKKKKRRKREKEKEREREKYSERAVSHPSFLQNE